MASFVHRAPGVPHAELWLYDTSVGLLRIRPLDTSSATFLSPLCTLRRHHRSVVCSCLRSRCSNPLHWQGWTRRPPQHSRGCSSACSRGTTSPSALRRRPRTPRSCGSSPKPSPTSRRARRRISSRPRRFAAQTRLVHRRTSTAQRQHLSESPSRRPSGRSTSRRSSPSSSRSARLRSSEERRGDGLSRAGPLSFHCAARHLRKHCLAHAVCQSHSRI